MTLNAAQRDFRVSLRDILTDYFSKEELRTLCFDLGLDYDNLPGSGRSGKARELVLQVERGDLIDDLIKLVRRVRPNAPWPDMPEAIRGVMMATANSPAKPAPSARHDDAPGSIDAIDKVLLSLTQMDLKALIALSRAESYRRDCLSRDAATRRRAVWALAEMVDDPLARLSLLDRLRNDDDPLIRADAAYGLGRQRAPDAVPDLIERCCEDDAAPVRKECARAMGEIGAASEAVVQTLAWLAKNDPDGTVSDAARLALQKLLEGASP